MKLNKGLYLLIAVLVLSGIILTACGPKVVEEAPAVEEETAAEEPAAEAETAAEEVVVTYRSWSPIVETTAKMVAATEAEYPGIKIEAEITDYSEYLIDLKARAASGELPDIIGLEPGALTQEYRDFLMPIQDCAESYWGENWQDGFYPIGIDQARLGNPSDDENFYGLPVLTQTINLWYTIPVYEEANFDVPTTYAEWLEQAEYFNDNGYAALLVGASDGWLNRDVFMQLIHNIAPGKIYEAEIGEAKFTDPEFVEAMTVWKKLLMTVLSRPAHLV